MPKAMVVDDSRTIRRILGGILAELGFEVCQAENGRDALGVLDRERAAGAPVSLALVDWNMPEMNGLEFVKRRPRRRPERRLTARDGDHRDARSTRWWWRSRPAPTST